MARSIDIGDDDRPFGALCASIGTGVIGVDASAESCRCPSPRAQHSKSR